MFIFNFSSLSKSIFVSFRQRISGSCSLMNFDRSPLSEIARMPFMFQEYIFISLSFVSISATFVGVFDWTFIPKNSSFPCFSFVIFVLVSLFYSFLIEDVKIFSLNSSSFFIEEANLLSLISSSLFIITVVSISFKIEFCIDCVFSSSIKFFLSTIFSSCSIFRFN